MDLEPVNGKVIPYEMPKGVEHPRSPLYGPTSTNVIPYEMPKGVEHLGTGLHALMERG
ncbi:MAG: hypothetical protein HYY13_06665 [Nitrospirae bacterium]|nr:hypothetical protein [Nitrospirota bacterium]